MNPYPVHGADTPDRIADADQAAFTDAATADTQRPTDEDGRGTPHTRDSRFEYPSIRGESGKLADD